MIYRCKIIKSFQSLPPGAVVSLNKEAYHRRKRAGEVVLIRETRTRVDESLIEDDGIHADNISEYAAANDPESKPIKKKPTKTKKKGLLSQFKTK